MTDMTAEEREFFGSVVRGVWVEWAKQQPNPKPSWLVPWSDLDEGQREVDMRIAEKVKEVCYPRWVEAIEDAEAAAEKKMARVCAERLKEREAVARKAALEEAAPLRRALEFYADGWEGHAGDSGPGGNDPQDPECWPSEALLDDAGSLARRALAESEKP